VDGISFTVHPRSLFHCPTTPGFRSVPCRAPRRLQSRTCPRSPCPASVWAAANGVVAAIGFRGELASDSYEKPVAIAPRSGLPRAPAGAEHNDWLVVGAPGRDECRELGQGEVGAAVRRAQGRGCKSSNLIGTAIVSTVGNEKYFKLMATSSPDPRFVACILILEVRRGGRGK